MPKSLIIVESPAKTKTLKNFLGNSYIIEASMGHVRDLPKSKLGVNIEENFQPQYSKLAERKDVITRLKTAAKKVNTVYLASDPDREGEAIAWHLKELLKLDNVKRITFNEITKSAVTESLSHPKDINMDLVNAQQARRVLDRLVGYKLSPLLWSKIKKNLSAGRVQSVAVRLICDRERQILAFIPVEYWDIKAELKPLNKDQSFEAQLVTINGKKAELSSEKETSSVLNQLNGAIYDISSIKNTVKKRNPALPFVTSTLEQEASRKLGFSTRKTMSIAQQLYEGIELGQDGHIGLITYMRTDSTRISKEAQDEVKSYIKENYGDKFLAVYKQKNNTSAQDAHEAIRPTSITRIPQNISKYMTNDQSKLYKLIWQRFLASMMAPAEYNVMTVEIMANDCKFRATGSTIKFEGFTKVYTEGKDDTIKEDEDMPPLPLMKEGDRLNLIKLIPKQHFTEPPARYTEATLVKSLESNGIGRPSTYHAIISTILDRKYVELNEKKFIPTDLGFIVNDKLIEHFPIIMDIKFTADVEKELDMVGEGKLEWTALLKKLYDPFEEQLNKAKAEMIKVPMEPTISDQVCPNCGKPMYVRESRFGEFLGCSDYPECKTTMPLAKKIDIKCPNCSDGNIIEKKSKKSKIFYGCDKYPDCTFVSWDRPTDKKCPECGNLLGEWRYGGKLVGYRCTSLDCKYQKYRSKKQDNIEETSKSELSEIISEK